MVPGAWHELIEISGQLADSAARIWIGCRKTNRELWDALVGAGGHPVGLPPANSGPTETHPAVERGYVAEITQLLSVAGDNPK
jgi:hypothetical protein